MKTAVRLVTAAVSAVLGATALAAPFTAGNVAVFQADIQNTNNTTFTILEVNSTTPNQAAPVFHLLTSLSNRFERLA